MDAEDWTDQTDPNMGVTPLMGLSFRPDNEETVKMAQVLLATRYKSRYSGHFRSRMHSSVDVRTEWKFQPPSLFD